jgi:hypothetical protein
MGTTVLKYVVRSDWIGVALPGFKKAFATWVSL